MQRHLGLCLIAFWSTQQNGPLVTTAAPPSTCHPFVIPLGVMDVDVIVQSDGDVHFKSETPIPQALYEAVSAVAGA